MAHGDKPVAIVTGATRGLGKAIALDLAQAGFQVVVTGRTLSEGDGRHDSMGGVPVPGSIETTIREIEAAGGSAIGLRLDLLDRDSIAQCVNSVLAQTRRIDAVVLNGIYQSDVFQAGVLAARIEEAERAAIGNFVNQLFLVQCVLPTMIERGGGRLIFMTTYSATIPACGASGLLYNAPKTAFTQIPDYINFEHAKDGISAFAIEPGFTMTDTLRAALGEDEAMKIGRGVEVHEPIATARTVTWLASAPDATSYAGPKVIHAPGFLTQK